MPNTHLPSPAVCKALRKLGADIKTARILRKLPMNLVAERANTSRPTIARIEKGDYAVSIGIYASVLQALGLLDGLKDIADPVNDVVGQSLASRELPKRARMPSKKG